MTTTLKSQKDLFQLEEGITYLNCANMSPLLKSVKEAGERAMEERAAPWNLTSHDWFINGEKLRGLAARVFQTSTDNMAIVSSASYGLAIAARNLKDAKREIIILDQQFPSNYYVWENLAREKNLQIVVVYKEVNKTLTQCILDKINSNTGIIAIPNCHWISGIYIDLQQISDAAKTVGAYFVLDLSQSMGVLPTDIEKLRPDFAVTVGYKWMLGPYGIGYMYVSPEWQERGEPLEYSWLPRKGTEDFTKLTDFVDEYRKGARKFDMGEYSHFNLLPMCIAALEQILAWDINSIQAYSRNLNEKLNDFRKSIGLFDETGLTVGHLASIPLSKLDANKLKKNLQEKKVVVSFRGTSIRIAPHLYNDMEDVNRLLSCLIE